MATQGRGEYRGMALCAALYGAALAAGVFFAGPRDNPLAGVLQVIAAALAALAFVTAEALWRMRPWAYRAARALAAGTLGVFVLPAIAALWVGEVAAGLGFLVPALCIGLVVWPMLGYLRRRASAPAHGVPVPRPRPRP